MTFELLRQHDDPVGVERPTDFDEDQLREQVTRLAQTLEHRFGVIAAEVGPPSIQDATFFANLRIEPGATVSGHGLWVRISNFGHLASAGATNPGVYGDEDLAQHTDEKEWSDLLDAIQSDGFEYVAEEHLWPDYDGQNEYVKAFYRETRGRLTWWVRFFDWV